MRPCLTCGTPTDGSYCDEHRPQRQPWQRSTPRRRTGSGWATQARNRRIMRQHQGVCHVCGQPGADEIDHVVALAESDDDSESNLAPIHSVPCHAAKTRAEAARGRRRR